MNDPSPGHRPVTRHELVEAAIIVAVGLVVTAVSTWLAGRLGVPVGWRLAAGACAAIFIVSLGRLAYYRRPPTLRWWGALLALWAMVLLTNLTAEVRFW